jgi:hypothetical protein
VSTSAEIYARRESKYRLLLTMAPLSHWPDRSKPFDPRNSQVIHYLMALGVGFDEAQRIFGRASKKGDPCKGKRRPSVLVFDHKTKLWRGRDYIPARVTPPAMASTEEKL